MRESFSPKWFAGNWDETPIGVYVIYMDNGGYDERPAPEESLVLLGPSGMDLTTIVTDEVARFHKGFDEWAAKREREQAGDNNYPKKDYLQMTPAERNSWHRWLRTWEHDNPLPRYPAERVADRLVNECNLIRLDPKFVVINYSK